MRVSHAANLRADRYIEELTDTEVYAAIRYLETESQGSKEPDDCSNVVIAIILLIFVLACLHSSGSIDQR